MSLYITDLSKEENYLFKTLKKEFKRNKPCANCGKKYSPHKMTVDHKVRVADGADLLDYNNWQVLCLDCHKIKSSQESLMDM